MSNPTIVTIWATYGPYHVARVNALKEAGFDLVCFSYAGSDKFTYPFFNSNVSNSEIINECDFFDINAFASFWKTYKLLCKHKPALIMSCGYERPETLAALIYTKIYSCKIFLFFVNQYKDSQRKQFIEILKKFYIRLFDGIVCGGNSHLEYLNILGYPKERIATGYNSVGNEFIQSQLELIRSQNQKLLSPYQQYFLCVARLIPKKNLFTLINAYTLYRDNLSNDLEPWKLVICGDGPLHELLLNKISENKLTDDVFLTGQINDAKDVINYYAYAKAFILPSSGNEQWGLVVNEAMAAGLPVIVSNQCGCSSNLVQDGINGFTFDANSEEVLAGQMLWMHRNQDKLPSMGQASREIVSEYSTQALASNVFNLYQKLL